MRKPGALALALCSLGVLAAAQAASAASLPIRATASTLSYESPTYAMAQGVKASFHNAGVGVPHNVTANGKLSGKPLFRSPTISGDGGTAVSGTQYLTTGDYTFFCSVHPPMQATLQVTGAGTPVARPSIRVSVLSGKLAKVQSTGKVRVRVRALTKSDNVALRLKLGAKQLASKANIDLAAGQVRNLVLKLGRKARNRLAGRSQAKVTLIGTVPFGKTRTASKLLK